MPESVRPQVRTNNDPKAYTDVGEIVNGGVPMPVTIGDSQNIDGFGRIRTSDTGQRFDVEFIYDKQPLIVDDVVGGSGSNTHNANSRDIVMATGGDTTNDYAYLYSHYDIPYTAGNSQLIDMTGTLDNAAIGGGTAQVFLRSNVTGSVVTTAIDQADWNRNTLSAADWSKSQILHMDFQSLKVGRIRFAIVADGVPITVHEIHNDNLRSTGYWQTPSLPISWRIYNDATYTYMEMAYGDESNAIGLRYRIAKNASATMRAICGTVKSEGGQRILNLNGYDFSADNYLTPKTASTTLVPILSIRPNATFNSKTNRIVIVPIAFELLTNNPIYYKILYRPTLTNPSWVAVNATYSGMQYDVTASAVTGGIVVASGYASTARNVLQDQRGTLGRVLMSLGRTGTSDILTVAAIRTTTSDADVSAVLEWKEIR